MAETDLGHFNKNNSERIVINVKDFDSGAAVSLDQAFFTWAIGKDTPTTWKYGVDSQITNPSTGKYVITTAFTKHGYGGAIFYATGTHIVSQPFKFFVDPDPFDQ